MRLLRFALATLVSIGFAASADMTFAQEKKKKVTREEAWSICTAEVQVIPADQHGQRYARGAACMKKFGYKI